MTSTGPNGYDSDLLASAPAASRAERQEGYNVDLLEKGDSPPPLSLNSKEQPPPPAPPQHAATTAPFWRTRKGAALIALLALVVLGAVVGGAVGGTVGKKHRHSDSSSASSSASMSSGGASQGVGSDAGPGPTVLSVISGATPAPSQTASALIGRK